MKLKDSNIFPIPGNTHMIHLGTISHNLREFIVMLCVRGSHRGKCYIEEVVLNTVDFSSDITANCKFITDDSLVEDLHAFAEEKGLLNMTRIEELLNRGTLPWILGNG